MAFVMALSPTYKTEVTVEAPIDGGFDKSVFTAEFKRCDTEGLERLNGMSTKDAVREVLVGWSALLDESKTPLPFSEEAREALMRIPQALRAIELAFWASVFKAAEKN